MDAWAYELEKEVLGLGGVKSGTEAVIGKDK